MTKICLDDLADHAGLAIGLVRSHRGPGIRLHVSLFAGPTDQTSRIARQQEGLGYARATDGPRPKSTRLEVTLGEFRAMAQNFEKLPDVKSAQ